MACSFMMAESKVAERDRGKENAFPAISPAPTRRHFFSVMAKGATLQTLAWGSEREKAAVRWPVYD